MKFVAIVVVLLFAVASATKQGKILCDRPCPMIYDPVCGNDGITYDNECAFENAACGEPNINTMKIAHPGPCKTEGAVVKKNSITTAKSCDTFCTWLLMPVCGSDGVTYSNKCMFNNANCKADNKLYYKEGACEKKPIVCYIRVCPIIYINMRVCGSNGVTYPSECVFYNSKCSARADWKISSKGECKKPTDPKCVKLCPMIYKPVCGSNGITYENKCMFENANCAGDKKIVGYGKCKKKPVVCTRVCPENYMPVCGSNGVTYSNKCVFENANCKSEKKMGYKEGACEKKPIVCSRLCPMINMPVCGSDGVTYPNECLFNNANCKADNKMDYKKGPCQKKPIACSKRCPMIYKPVCGSNGITYPNECMFNHAKCKGDKKMGYKEGACQKKPISCSRLCPMIYKPVCGSNGETYSNECTFKNANCKADKKMDYKEGACQKKPIVCSKRCPMIYKPVCASNGITHPNDCMFNNANCKADKKMGYTEGACQKKPIACSKLCTKINKPVCGSDGVTYPNECMFNNANCKADNKMYYKEGACQKIPIACAKVCPENYKPVCGSNGVTYSNKCVFENDNCAGDKKMGYKEGACQKKPIKPVCSRRCTKINKPVCGSDGETYPNECMFNNANCKSDNKMYYKEGACEKKPIKPVCSRVCIMIYKPVCGSNGETYSNECAFKNANCRADKKMYYKEGACQKKPIKPVCSKACGMIYKPVCGSNGVTYPNECVFHNSKCSAGKDWNIAKEGACEKPTKPDCPILCPAIYVPVCGSNGRTYSSKCIFEADKCKAGAKWEIVSEGACNFKPVQKLITKSVTNPVITTVTTQKPVTNNSGGSSTMAQKLRLFFMMQLMGAMKPKVQYQPTNTKPRVQYQPTNTKPKIQSQPTITKPKVQSQPTITKPNCSRFCLMNYMPVCGSNGVTYNNICVFNNAKCSSGEDWQIAYKGRCTPTSN